MNEITIKNLQKNVNNECQINSNRSFLNIVESIGKVTNYIYHYHELEYINHDKMLLREELSNIIFNLVLLANSLNINLEEIIYLKEELNALRYNRENFLANMKEDFCITDFQLAIRRHENLPNDYLRYLYKLIEEVGELSEVLRRNKRMTDDKEIKGTIEEEIHDVFYYSLCILSDFQLTYNYDQNVNVNDKLKVLKI